MEKRNQGVAQCHFRSGKKDNERVELEVFRSNDSAVRLYEANGFLTEGVMVDARKLDGKVDDILLFAAFKNA